MAGGVCDCGGNGADAECRYCDELGTDMTDFGEDFYQGPQRSRKVHEYSHMKKSMRMNEKFMRGHDILFDIAFYIVMIIIVVSLLREYL